MTVALSVRSPERPPRADRVLGTSRPYLLLILYCTLLWLPGVLSIPASDRDESRFAQGSRQMLQSGDFIRIQNGAEARNRKPVGIYWLQVPFAAAAEAAGVATENPIWPFRLPSLLGGIAAVLAVFGLWRHTVGDKAALLAALMLGASIVLAAETGIATTDAVLLAATSIAMGLLGRAYLDSGPLSRAGAAAFWLAIGAGILLKGPITPMVAGLAALSLAVADRRAGGAGWLRGLRPGWGVLLMLAVVLPWFVAIGIATHGVFFVDSLGGDLAGKIEGADDGHGALPGYHLLLLPVLALPSSILVLRALPGAWRGRAEPLTRFLLAWIVPSWLVFEAVPTKLPHYTLPIYPALFLLAASWVLNPSRPPGPRWFARASETAFVIAAAVIGIAAAVLPFVVRPGLDPEHLLGLPALLAAGAVAIFVRREARRQDWTRAALMGVLTAPLLSWAILWVELPHLSALWIASKAAAVLDAHWRDGRPADGAFGAAGFHEPSLMFLCGTETRLFPTGWDATRFLGANPDAVVAIAERDLHAFREQAERIGFNPHEFASVNGYNYSRGRRTELLFFSR